MNAVDVTETLSIFFHLFFFVLMLVFIIHACILGYHWFSYGSARKISMVALAIYLSGAAFLLVTMSGFLLFI
jgi:hypothetical protein